MIEPSVLKPVQSIRIAIPAFNEAERLPRFLEELERVGVLREPGVEVVVVDDGSEVSQSAVMADAVKRLRGTAEGGALRYMKLARNRGKGGAVYAAWDEPGEVDLLAFLDADGSVSGVETLRLLRLAAGCPEKAFFASRVKMLGRTVDRGFKRHLLGRTFASLVGVFVEPGVYDSQCGLKIIPAAQYLKFRSWLRECRFAFDVELVAALVDTQCRIVEVPIDWRHVPGSKVNLFRESLQMFQGVIRIAKRRRQWQIVDD